MNQMIVVLLVGMMSFGCAYAKASTSSVNQMAAVHGVVQQAIVNLNKADMKTLMTLSGIGKTKAQAIIDYRRQHGAFKTTQDLIHVKGFSQATVDKVIKNNLDRIQVNVKA